MIVGGMAIIGCVDNLMGLVAQDAGLWQFHAMRTALAVPMLLVVTLFFGLRLKPKRWQAVAIRTTLLSGSMMLYFGALPLMPIAQVGAGLFTAPLFVLIFSAIGFRVPVGPRRWSAVLLGFAGVLIMLRVESQTVTAVTLMPVAAGALYAMNTMVTRRLCAEEATTSLLFAFFCTMGLVGLLGVIVTTWVGTGEGFLSMGWQPITSQLMLIVLFQAVFSLIAVFFLTRGYQSAETTFLTVFEYSFLVFAAIWAWVLFGTTLGIRDALGLSLIIISGVIVAVSGRTGQDRAVVQ